jgi:hypothetical protein
MLALTGRLRDVKRVRDSAVLGTAATDSLITKHVAKNLMARVINKGKYDERNVKLSPTNIRCRPLAPNLASAPYLTAHVKRTLGGNDPFIN